LRREGEIASQRDIGLHGAWMDWSGRTTTEFVAEAREVRAVGDSTHYADGGRLELTASQRIRLNGARFALSFTERWLEKRTSLVYVWMEQCNPRCTPDLSRRCQDAALVAGNTQFEGGPLSIWPSRSRSTSSWEPSWRSTADRTQLELYDAALDESSWRKRLAQRLDDRLWAGAGTTFRLTAVLDLDLEYLWLNSVSNLGTSNRTIDTTMAAQTSPATVQAPN